MPIDGQKTLRALVRDYERSLLVSVLKRNDFCRRKTAEAFGMTMRGLERALARHGLTKIRYSKKLPFTWEDIRGQVERMDHRESGAD